MKGWLVSSSPDTQPGESTPWYASFWEFCGRYCQARFGTRWHFSPEHSLFQHAESTVVPSQVVIHSPLASNNNVALPFHTSLFDLKVAAMPPKGDLVVRNGLRLFTPEAALVRVTESLYQRYPVETRIVLASLPDASGVLRCLLAGGHSVVAGRIAGAFRRIGRPGLADEVLGTMRRAGYDVRENDPFTPTQAMIPMTEGEAPIAARLRTLWAQMRGGVEAVMPPPPGVPLSHDGYLRHVEDVYQSDAYHSLSIEGYTVSPDLIERVRAGDWDPERRTADRRNRDALAARGYWQSFQLVKEQVIRILQGTPPAAVARDHHGAWYRELFQPCVAAGILPARALAGYRNDAVYLRTSRYVPPRWEAVPDAMRALFHLLAEEPHPGVRAVMGHWMFGYIHPYPDGNGRLARFLMNALFAAGGYPWTVIRIEDRQRYLKALDAASLESNATPFAELIVERMPLALTAGF